MAKRRRISEEKKKESRKLNAIRAGDVVFTTLVHDEQATIVAEQGMVMLFSEESQKVYRLPSGVTFPYEAYGESVTITVRNITDEVILELDEDDIYEADLSKKANDKKMPVDNWHDVVTLMDERRLQIVMKAFQDVGTFVAGIVLSVFCYWLTTTEFQLMFLSWLGLVVGIVIAGVGGLVPAIKHFRQSTTKVIADGAGNHINLDTGKTNMNGGMMIPIKGV